MSLKRIKLPEYMPTLDVRINGVWVGKGVVTKDGVMLIAPAVFEEKPEKDARGVCYPVDGFVVPLPDEYKRAFAAVPAEQLPLNVSVEF